MLSRPSQSFDPADGCCVSLKSVLSFQGIVVDKGIGECVDDADKAGGGNDSDTDVGDVDGDVD